MGRYSLRFRASVAKDLRAIPKQDLRRILNRIERLADDPRPSGCEKLSGEEKYRVRQGVYRILYEIADSELIVTVVKVAHRRHAYRGR
ncbi:MAG: type II toxin-antitoxin system RelE/ParE family toxin [Spirochaetes bacterium]|jgi:mRNA interferase RelE/StbE|nr:type II toxin-antitoxin system RelE/ParE family toxin [Spirochaetota bacterium]